MNFVEWHNENCGNENLITVLGVSFCTKCRYILGTENSISVIEQRVAQVKDFRKNNRPYLSELTRKQCGGIKLEESEIELSAALATFRKYEHLYNNYYPTVDIDTHGNMHGDDNGSFYEYLCAVDKITELIPQFVNL